MELRAGPGGGAAPGGAASAGTGARMGAASLPARPSAPRSLAGTVAAWRRPWRLVSVAAVGVRGVVVAVVAVLAVSAGCGGGGETDRAAPTTSAATATTSASAPVLVLVTNDDGYQAPGIDAAARALAAEPGVTVRVVAPKEDRSGTGEQATPGPVAYEPARTASGMEAVAVAGFPVDAVRVALDELGLAPDLVVSGINRGQNVGPFVNVSGTVSAAKMAASRGVPAVAVSQGLGEPPDYGAGVALLLEWFRAHRAALPRLRGVFNLNVPTCAAGRVRGLVTVPVARDIGDRKVFDPVDCRSSAPPGPDDVGAFLAGFATVSELAA